MPDGAVTADDIRAQQTEAIASRRGRSTAGRVRVVDVTTGDGGTVDSESIEAALATGRVRLANASEQQAAAQTEAFGDQGALAFGQGALNTLTFGALETGRSVAIGAENETAAAAGSLAAGLGLGALTGGALSGVRAAGLGGRLIAGAAEGAVTVAAESRALSTERAIGDPALAGESIMATLGASALFGGVLGGAVELGIAGIGGAGRRLLSAGSRSATRDAVGTMIRRTTGRDALPGVADAILDRIGRTGTTGLGEAETSIIRRGLSRSPEGRAFRQVLERGDGVIDDALRPLRSQIDDLQQIGRLTADQASGTLKRGQIRRLVSESGLVDAAEELAGFQGAIRRVAGDLGNEAGLPGSRALVRRLTDMVEQADGEIATAIQSGGRDGAADAFIALDGLKRKFGRETAKARRNPNFRFLSGQMDEAYEVGRTFLEREDLFGAAGVAQRDINARWHEMIGTSQAFRRRFLTDIGENEGFDRLVTADPQKLQSWLRQTGTGAAGAADDLFDNYLTRTEAFNRAVSENYDLPARVAAAHASGQTALAAIRETRRGIQSSVAARNQFNEAVSQLAARDGILSQALPNGALAGAVAGGAPGAIAGGVLGAAIGTLRRPDRVVRMLASVERMTATFQTRVGRSSSQFVQHMMRPPRSAPHFRGAVVGMTAAQVARGFDALTETVAQNRDPADMIERIAQQTGDLSDAAPNTATSLASTVARAQAYLQSQMPALAYDAPGMLGAPRTTPSDRVTEDEQRSLLLVARTIDDPLSVLDAAEAGILAPEHTATLRAVYPMIHQQLVQSVVTEIADNGDEMSYQSRLTVSLLLDVPTDPSLTPEYIRAAQATFADDESAESQLANGGPMVTPGNITPPHLSDSVASEQSRLSSRRS